MLVEDRQERNLVVFLGGGILGGISIVDAVDLVPFMMTWAPISMARNAAAVSVEK
jgi:hypothetical protein